MKLSCKKMRKKNAVKEKQMQNGNEIQEIENEIRETEKGIEVAEKAISDGSKQLTEHLKAKTLDTIMLKKDNSLIQMGIERKHKLASELCDLRKKKKAKLNQSKK